MSVRVILPFWLLAVCLSGWAQQDGSVSSLSDADEIKVGQILAKQFEEAEGMSPTRQTDELDKYLQHVGDKVTAHASRKLPYHFHFDPSPGFRSAFGLPGGEIFVGAGILAYLDTEDQLAAVLGHEVEHIDLNHCRDRVLAQLAAKHLTLAEMDKLKIDDFLPGYGHDGELAADREGVRIAAEAGYAPEGAIRLLRTYIILGQNMPNTKNEAQQRLEERIAQIDRMLRQKEVPAGRRETPLSLP
jgi:predicted Zn-dependent protease